MADVFGSNAGNGFGFVLTGKGPHKPEVAYDIVGIHSLMTYTDMIGKDIVGNTKAPFMRCLPYISKQKPGKI